MSKISQRVATISPSMTLAMSAKAAELKAAGENVISFGVGEPDFATPAHIVQAAKDALDAGYTKYVARQVFPHSKRPFAKSSKRKTVWTTNLRRL